MVFTQELPNLSGNQNRDAGAAGFDSPAAGCNLGQPAVAIEAQFAEGRLTPPSNSHARDSASALNRLALNRLALKWLLRNLLWSSVK